jgi:hypothetical protein
METLLKRAGDLYLRSNDGTSPSPALLALVGRLRDPADPLRAAALDALRSDGALHPAHAAAALDRVTARYTPAALDALRTRELAGRRVRVVLAASVATAPLRALALPLLRGAASVALKPSRHQPRFAALLGDAVPDAPFDHLIAYGADDTLAALRASLPAGVTFEGRGHGFALSIVRTTNHRDAAARVAEDVAWYDQRGCLSPQAVLVTAGDPGAFAAQLHEALVELSARLPRGPLDVGLGAAVMQWRGVHAATARRFWRGDDHAVALHDAPSIGSPGARHVTVAGVDESGLLALVSHHARWLTALGVDGPTADLATVPCFAGRLVPAGTLQDPPLDGPEDPRPPLTA